MVDKTTGGCIHMTGDDNEKAGALHWWEKRTLVITWLLFFFPVGLYGLWKGDLFTGSVKKIITGVVIAVLLILGGGEFLDFVYVFILCPIGIYLLWKDPDISKSTTYRFGGALAVLILVVLTAVPSPQTNTINVTGGSCTAVTQSGGCTYYRDASCRVIAQQCN